MFVFVPGFGWIWLIFIAMLPFFLAKDHYKRARSKAAPEEVRYLAHGRLAYLSPDEKAAFDLSSLIDQTASLYKNEISRTDVEKIVLDAARETGVLACKTPFVLKDAQDWLLPYRSSIPFTECQKIALRRGLPPLEVSRIVGTRQIQLQKERLSKTQEIAR